MMTRSDRAGAYVVVPGVLLLILSGCGPSELDELRTRARTGERNEQRLALRSMAELGPAAAPAIGDLLELCQHAEPDVRRLAGLALGNIAATLKPEQQTDQLAVLEALTAQLEDSERSVRNTAAFALLGLDPDHPTAQVRLLEALQQGDGGIIDRLTKTTPPPMWVAPALIDVLSRDQRPGIRRLAAAGLGQIAPDDPDVRQALRRALDDPDDRVRGAAQESLSASDTAP